MDASSGRFRACLLAGAIGDALGAPVEFWSLSEIRSNLGPEGVTGYVDGEALITDDTQMTLFTAESLIRASIRYRSRGICHLPTMLHYGYLRWLHTQSSAHVRASGWLMSETRLHHRRAPGNTCLSALQSGKAGSMDSPLNNSKGCGGVMRVAPVGLFVDPDQAFLVGCEAAAITHGHPSGWLPAGVLSAIIALLVGGATLPEAVQQATEMLLSKKDHYETVRALDAGIALASNGIPSPEQLEQLGGGWVGEEALAIAVCCALAASDLRSGLLASVNHSGDTDSTGAICGNLLGAERGIESVPSEWISPLDVADIVIQVADDLWRERFEPPIPQEWWDRYPGT